MRGRRSGRVGDRGSVILRILWFVVVVLGWLLIAAAAVAIWLHFYASRGEVATAATAVVPFAVLGGVLAVVFFAIARRWIALVLAVVVVGVAGWTQYPLWVHDDASGGARVTVVSANIRLGAGDVNDLVERVRSTGADVLAVQELSPEALQRLRDAGIGTLLPNEYSAPKPGGRGGALFTRQPMRDRARVPNLLFENLRAVIDLPGVGATTVFSVHPVPPVKQQALPDAPRLWATELSMLGTELRGVRGPAIAAGDFNSGYDHKRFRDLLVGGYRDAGDTAGAGLLPTYPEDRWWGPAVTLDHVISTGWRAESLSSFTVGGSDHRGLVAVLRAG
ncbi:endonuclease/exonuclease/phosphatase family protein [Williamsia sterculiae]|uniref:Uncharacterized conserved protein YafD, endonuclease/exonuclease/phosphatase (EEP) superfamily n=1 Tax=Williamsia sterculiae TaxID=1344003 RepID=A0A1N7G9N5_9NOCA|nr:endonuclease/exonuclease/phosphatase family protein [Williamsia sterculiae]SIS09325.1 Uncharacterized conserved protein YafD, endonuclease/exonuclease/phosphatase (EEP) superfamily [Williamsia sterculiae]